MVEHITYQVIGCVLCEKKLRIPRDIGTIRVTCPGCQTQWEMSTRTRAKVQAADAPEARPAAATPAGTRSADFDPYVPSSPVEPSARGHASSSNALGSFVYGVWLCGGFIAIPYYNWQFAQQHGFTAWLFLGEIIPTMQGVLWPLTLLIGYFSAHA